MPHSTIPTKTCPKCGESKPATTEYFVRDSHRRDGLQVWCKACFRVYHEANKERIAERARSYRAANKERLNEHDREYHRARREANRELYREQARAWRAANKARYSVYREAGKERVRTWYEANRGRVAESNRTWYDANKERKAETTRAWAVANSESRRVSAAHRRARIRNAEGTHTAADVQAQYARQKGLCYYAACGNSKLGDTYHVDHVVPLSRGGSNWPENIVLACPTCNMSKSAKLPHEWAQGGRLL